MKLPQSDLEEVFARTPDVWEKLRGQRLFLTGGTGFFGTWLVESFLHANSRLKLGASLHLLTRSRASVLERLPHLSGETALEYVEGDVTSFKFPQGQFSHIIHAATPTTQHKDPKALYGLFQCIVQGTARVLEFASQSGARRLLHTSSGGAYGRQPASIPQIGEDYAGAPLISSPFAAYGEGKRVSEFLLACRSQAPLESLNARCFAFVGPRLPLDAHYAIGNFMGDALRESPIAIQGDGTPLRSYLYASDLTVWLWRLLTEGKAGATYNVGSEKSVSIRETAEAVARAAQKLGLKSEVRIQGVAIPGTAPERYIPSTQLARSELDLDAWTDLNEGIERTLRWHLESSAR